MEDPCISSIPTVNGVLVDTCTVQPWTVMGYNYVHASIHRVKLIMSCLCEGLILPVLFGQLLRFSFELQQYQWCTNQQACIIKMNYYIFLFLNSSTRLPLNTKDNYMSSEHVHVVVIYF